jgi:hypothetical protein
VRISDKALREIESALAEYGRQVNSSPLTESTKQTYLLHAGHFVAWLRNEFVSGGRKQ